MDKTLFRVLVNKVCKHFDPSCEGCPFYPPPSEDKEREACLVWHTDQEKAELILATWIGGETYLTGSAKQEQKKIPENRREILQAAERCVCGGRELDHGTPEQSFHAIALHFTAFLEAKGLLKEGARIDAADAAAMLALFKVARVAAGNFVADSYVDACGYLACSGELAAEREKEANRKDGEES